MDEQFKQYLLALNRMQGIGPISIAKLLDKYPTLTELFSFSAINLAEQGIPQKVIDFLQQTDLKGVSIDMAWSEAPLNKIITIRDEAYPRLFRETHGMPAILFCRGDISLLNSPQIALVGSRNPSPSGTETAFEFAKYLTASGFTITSGLALGIDAASHRGALAAKGKTIAVMGAGLDRIYPARHKELAEEIVIQGGLLISEFPIATAPKPEHFPRRNRLISGLSLGVLVVEAALQSGSLITAQYALEQGREVFAIPGSIHNPLAKGCHALLKQGAKLVETVADITQELGVLSSVMNRPQVTLEAPQDSSILAKMDKKLVECIGYEATPMDILIYRSGMTADEICSRLVVLELQGYVTVVAGGYVKNKRVCKA